MTFWILTAVVMFFTGWWIFISWTSDLIYTVVGRILVGLGELVVGAFAWALVALAGSAGLVYLFDPTFEKVGTTSSSLVALSAKDTTEGEFHGSIFASYGYVDGKRALSYISSGDDDGLRLGYVDATDSVVYQGTRSPRIDTHHWAAENGWFFPFGPVETAETYSLYVPEGSVTEGFEVTP